MTIWNADTGTRISRFTFTETITAFTFNPFQTEQLICKLYCSNCMLANILSIFLLVLSQECFIFVNDFSPLRTPTGGGKKLYMSMPQNNGGVWGGNKVKDTRQLVSGDSQRYMHDHMCATYYDFVSSDPRTACLLLIVCR